VPCCDALGRNDGQPYAAHGARVQASQDSEPILRGEVIVRGIKCSMCGYVDVAATESTVQVCPQCGDGCVSPSPKMVASVRAQVGTGMLRAAKIRPESDGTSGFDAWLPDDYTRWRRTESEPERDESGDLFNSPERLAKLFKALWRPNPPEPDDYTAPHGPDGVRRWHEAYVAKIEKWRGDDSVWGRARALPLKMFVETEEGDEHGTDQED
jgi:hypothetical protein